MDDLLKQARAELGQARTHAVIERVLTAAGPAYAEALAPDADAARQLIRSIFLCPVRAAVELASVKLAEQAAAAGLYDFALDVQRGYCQKLGWYTNYTVMAKAPGTDWLQREYVRVSADSLPEVEAAFLAGLQVYNATQAAGLANCAQL